MHICTIRSPNFDRRTVRKVLVYNTHMLNSIRRKLVNWRILLSYVHITSIKLMFIVSVNKSHRAYWSLNATVTNINNNNSNDNNNITN